MNKNFIPLKWLLDVDNTNIFVTKEVGNQKDFELVYLGSLIFGNDTQQPLTHYFPPYLLMVTHESPQITTTHITTFNC